MRMTLYQFYVAIASDSYVKKRIGKWLLKHPPPTYWPAYEVYHWAHQEMRICIGSRLWWHVRRVLRQCKEPAKEPSSSKLHRAAVHEYEDYR